MCEGNIGSFRRYNMKKYVLGVKIDDINMEEAISIVDGWLSDSKKHYIVTPNPEFLVTAQKDPQFRKILNNADLAIPDGVGLRLGGIKYTVAGTDLMETLCDLASKKDLTVGLLGGRDGVAEEAGECLIGRYPGLKVGFISKEWTEGESVDLLFVAFGHPKQEKWIFKKLPMLNVKVAMGVGGAFDYISGKVPRAPIWMRNLGLEWLFRLSVQPWRIKRQLSLLKYIWLLTRKLH